MKPKPIMKYTVGQVVYLAHDGRPVRIEAIYSGSATVSEDTVRNILGKDVKGRARYTISHLTLASASPLK